MKKVLIIVGIVLIVLGIALVTLAVLLGRNGLLEFTNAVYNTNTYTVEENFTSIMISTKDVDINIENSDDGNFKAVCYEVEKYTTTFKVENNTLIVKYTDDRTLQDNLKSNARNQTMTLYLPSTYYEKLIIQGSTGDVEIKENFEFNYLSVNISTGNIGCYSKVKEQINLETSTGDIKIKNAKSNNIKLKVTTGKIEGENIECDGKLSADVSTGYAKLRDINCSSFKSIGGSGDIVLNSVIVKDTMSIDRSTGDIDFDNCDANEIYITTSTGNVKGTLLSNKIFITKTNTGKIKVSESMSGGKCSVTTNTGDIIITIANKE